MFDNNKACTVIGLLTDALYLVGMYFLVRLAGDDAIYVVGCIAAVLVAAALSGRCARSLFADGGLLCRVAGILVIGIFAVGTLVVIYLGVAANIA